MHTEFVKNTRKFGVKRSIESIHANEAIVKFENSSEMQAFFEDSMRNVANLRAIRSIADDIAPSYIRRSLRSAPPLSEQQRLDYLFSEIDKGQAYVVLKNNQLESVSKAKKPKQATKEQDFFERLNLYQFTGNQVDQLKNIFSKIVHADYSILETVFTYNEDTVENIPVVIDPSSVNEHSSGWTSWDKPFEIAVLGAFKAVATYHVAAFLNISNSIRAAALTGSQTELVSAQYNVTGKSIVRKKWYGSYAIRYNLKKLSWEIPWVKFKGCGPEERVLVELKREDRLMFHKKPVYNHNAQIIPPFMSMEKYLSAYRNGLPMPEHDVNKPIRIDSAFKYL